MDAICSIPDEHIDPRGSAFFPGKIGTEGYPDARRQCLFDFITKRQRHQKYGRLFRRIMNLRWSWLNATGPLSRLSGNGANATVSRIAATPLSSDHPSHGRDLQARAFLIVVIGVCAEMLIRDVMRPQI